MVDSRLCRLRVAFGNFLLYRKERNFTTHPKLGGVLLAVNNSLNHMGVNLVFEREDDIVSCLVEDILVFCIYNPPASMPIGGQ